jgi:hypothetical protein
MQVMEGSLTKPSQGTWRNKGKQYPTVESMQISRTEWLKGGYEVCKNERIPC